MFFGGPGDDLLVGGDGEDVASFAGAPVDFVAVHLGFGRASGEGQDRLGGIEGVIGTEGDDILEGSASDDFLSGKGGR